jgi:hypothetical protein
MILAVNTIIPQPSRSSTTNPPSMTKRILFAGTILLLLVSFTQPAFYTDNVQKDAWSNSAFLFFLGWMGMLTGSAGALPWLANPVLVIGVIFFLRKKPLPAFILSVIAMAIAASFLLVRTIVVSERPDYAGIAAYKAGYWLWLGSMAVFSATTIFAFLQAKKDDPAPQPD